MLIFKSILLVAIVFGVEINFAKCRIPSLLQDAKETCESPICRDTALKLENQMDWSVEPCDNFYKFVCGNFLKTTVVPDDQDKVDPMVTLTNDVARPIKVALEADISPNDTRASRLTKTFYQNCLDTQTIQQQGLKPLRKVLKSLGGWPLVDSRWFESRFDWRDFNYKTQRLGYYIHPFMLVTPAVDAKNSSRFVIKIQSPPFHLGQESDEDTVQAYKTYMFETALLLNSSVNVDRVLDEINEVVDFNIQLDNISMSSSEKRDLSATYNPMTVAELTKRFPYVSWLDYLNKVLKPHVIIDEDEVVIVSDLKYFSELGEVLRQTPKRIQANYAIWRVILSSVDYLDDEIRDKQLEFLSVTEGQTEYQERWKECIEMVKGSFSIGVSETYARHYLDKEAKRKISDMFANIRWEFIKTISKADWLDEVTRAKALKKLERMTITIGNPEQVSNEAKLDNYLRGLEITSGNLLANFLNASRFGFDAILKQFRRPVSDVIWIQFAKAAEVRASYYLEINHILVTAGIMRGHYFNEERPRYINFGAIGYTLGHEMTHGFDNIGSQIDENGKFVNWWNNETMAVFSNKTRCFTEQFGNFTDELTKINVNPYKTLSEVVADNGGVSLSYRAYRELEKKQGEEPALPGYENYTSQQMFWISVASTWCTKYTEQSLRNTLLTDVHPPGEFRVNGNLQNQEDFARDFHCPKGSYMNPVDKCFIW